MQEVIPEIYDIFQRSRWWKAYRCSVSSDMEFTKGYFCMQVIYFVLSEYYDSMCLFWTWLSSEVIFMIIQC